MIGFAEEIAATETTRPPLKDEKVAATETILDYLLLDYQVFDVIWLDEN
ncbi:MAG: hypothetical protein KAI83_16600 [Thiomargarita sp.]|nr:hypothetical protein [Thiomargarita sp.]